MVATNFNLVNSTNSHSAATPNFVNTDTSGFCGFKGIGSSSLAASASAISGGRKTRTHSRSKKNKRRSRRHMRSSKRRNSFRGGCGCAGTKFGGSSRKNKKCICSCHKGVKCNRPKCGCKCHKYQRGGMNSVTNYNNGYSTPGFPLHSSELALANPPPIAQAYHL